MDEVYKLDLREYRLLCKAKAYKDVDLDFRIHQLAYACNKATLTNKKGKLIYADFNKLYDYKKALAEVERVEEKEAEGNKSAFIRYIEKKRKQKGGDSK